ncbi:MAG: glutamine synthetase family protein [Rhodobacteraceae bacterium]|nr:glutamine synthetase family protein [Paracoccaceae bacterium]
MTTKSQAKNQAWLAAHPEIKSLRIAASDLNGLPRGKRIPASQASKAFGGDLRMPLSTLNVDIWGEDIEESPLLFDSGDADGSVIPTERGLVPMTWFATPSALLPLWMFNDRGQPFSGDPRHALKAVLDRFAEQGLTPVVATELEFHLLDGKASEPTPPISPLTGQTVTSRDVLSINGLDAFDEFFTDLYDACEAMGLPADAAISESGLGQFEINLLHTDDAMKAADDTWLFKLAVRGVARKHGFAASFMAKPYADEAGNGMHTHFSVLDESGANIFDDGTAQGSDRLRHAVGGCLKAMRASTLVFAPHFNSYRRMAPNSHAPTAVSWGYENRTAAVRIPGGNPKSRRIEHRVSGGDANPYLMLAVVLGAALVGMDDAIEPPAPVSGNTYDADLPRLPMKWSDAVDLFEGDPMIARIFHENLIRNYVMCKRQEITGFINQPRLFEFTTYMETV